MTAPAKRTRIGRPGALHRDRRGQVSLEWALILAAVAIPMLAVFRLCLRILAAKYEWIAFINALPFP